MTGSKKRLYIALMLLGGIALLVDRVFLASAGPEAAQAATNPRSTTADSKPTTIDPQSSIPKASPIPELQFPRQLPALDLSVALRDWFAPPARPKGREEGVSTDKGAPGEEEFAELIVSAKEAFVADHHLDGVVIQKGLRMAIVDGVWLRIGQEFDECTLSALSGRTAVFTCADGDAVLTLFQNLLQSQP
jgi:hypothetical protein